MISSQIIRFYSLNSYRICSKSSVRDKKHSLALEPKLWLRELDFGFDLTIYFESSESEHTKLLLAPSTNFFLPIYSKFNLKRRTSSNRIPCSISKQNYCKLNTNKPFWKLKYKQQFCVKMTSVFLRTIISAIYKLCRFQRIQIIELLFQMESLMERM